MTARHLPVRPNLTQLKHQAKDLLRELKEGQTAALALFAEHHPSYPVPEEARLADAQLVLARAYDVRSWPRLVLACRVVEAIWEDDLETLRDLVTDHPELLHESARGVVGGDSWGPPMSHAANLGRDAIIRMLHAQGAKDLEKAAGRAALRGKVATARMIHEWMGSPTPVAEQLGGPAYTLNVAGTQLMLELGAPVVDEGGRPLAPVDVVLETDSRNPAAKHAILEAYAAHGLELPDTPTMALHGGRIDLLEAHVDRDPDVLDRRFTHEEIYPPDWGCHDEVQATQGTPLKGTTLLHLCADYDEIEIARWLLERGADPNVPALVDGDGFGGHTVLFGTVVSQPAYWMNRRAAPSAAFTELLLDAGADPMVRASIRKELHPGYDNPGLYEYRDVTARSWGERFHDKRFVNQAAIDLIAARGGQP